MNPSVLNRMYWNNRHRRMKEELFDSVELTENEIREIFDATIERLESRLSYWYYRFGFMNDVSLQQARQILDAKQLRDFKITLEEYKRLAQSGNPAYRRFIENASIRQRLTKEQVFVIETTKFIHDMTLKMEDKTYPLLYELYRSSYYQMAYETQLQEGFRQMDAVNDVHIKSVINERWTADNEGISDRIWTNQTNTISTLKKTLTQGFLLKHGLDSMTRNFRRDINTSYFNARRLIETEAAHVIESASFDVYDKLNVKKYQILATLDKRTSKICRHLDMKIVDTKDYKTGVTAPPFHPHCRTTTVPYIEGEKLRRAYRDEDGKTKYVEGSISYNEWYEKYVHDE